MFLLIGEDYNSTVVYYNERLDEDIKSMSRSYFF